MYVQIESPSVVITGHILPSKWASEETNRKSQMTSGIWIVAAFLEGTVDENYISSH